MPRDDIRLVCQRMHGGSVRDCACMLSNGGGWLECPDEARGILIPSAPLAVLAIADHLALVRGLPPISPAKDTTADQPARHAAIAEPTGFVRAKVRREKQTSLAGDICSECFSPNVVWAGTCRLCRDCGSTSGGCS